ncbi:uncharacterized protein [Amphiura filiformis]|uniref:uncharacterized protein n=1 Tax=Amphiura filiformis TaxID=82378 RepID=UPI003B216C72
MANDIRCSYYKQCLEVTRMLNLSDKLLDLKSRVNKCYCDDCHTRRGESYSFRDGPGSHNLYTKPVGWGRIMLSLPPRAEHLNIFKKWNAAFHGTAPDIILPIVEGGELLFPGDKTMHGETLREVAGHFNDDSKPDGFNTKQVFLSPSIKYSGCEVYAKKGRMYLQSMGRHVYVRTVLQVRVKPDQFIVGPQTIGRSDPIDPPIDNKTIEWALSARNSVIPTAVLIQVLDSPGASSSVDQMSEKTAKLTMSGATGFAGITIDHSTTTANDEKVDYAIGCAVSAKGRGKTEGGIADYIQDEFDKKYEPPNWHCIVGKGYTCYTECDPGCKIRFTMGDDGIYLFRYRIGTEPKPSPRAYPHISPYDRKMIRDSEMDTEMEYHVFDCCKRACDWYSSNDERVKYIKEEFDKEHDSGWNCILGVNSVASVSYNHKCYISLINFGKDNMHIFLWRC